MCLANYKKNGFLGSPLPNTIFELDTLHTHPGENDIVLPPILREEVSIILWVLPFLEFLPPSSIFDSLV